MYIPTLAPFMWVLSIVVAIKYQSLKYALLLKLMFGLDFY